MRHIYPLNDLRKHDLKSTMCDCYPQIDFALPDILVLHNAFDGRDMKENYESNNPKEIRKYF